MSWQLKSAYLGLLAGHRVRERGDQDPEVVLTSLDPERRETRPPKRIVKSTQITPFDVAGRRVLKLIPNEGSTGVNVLYLHGGGYIYPVLPAHWAAIGALLDQGATVWLPSYGLAPEHTIDDTLPLIDALYAIVDQVRGENPLILMGDSAGGGLALATAIRARDEGWRRADRIVLFSPWVDVNMTNPEAKELEPKDNMLVCSKLQVIGRAWAGQRSTTDPMVSPLYDTLANLPEILIYQGEYEVFTPDVREFARKARAAGTIVTLAVVPGAGHAYALAPWIPESAQALRESLEGLTAAV